MIFMLNDGDIATLDAQLQSDEGFSQHLYTDVKGKVSIGYGFNLTDEGLSLDESRAVLALRLQRYTIEMQYKYPWIFQFTPPRIRALINMYYNLGSFRFSEFVLMLGYLFANNFKGAYKEILDSEAAKENPERYKRIADTILSGDDKC
jgi:lysozyme